MVSYNVLEYAGHGVKYTWMLTFELLVEQRVSATGVGQRTDLCAALLTAPLVVSAVFRPLLSSCVHCSVL